MNGKSSIVLVLSRDKTAPHSAPCMLLFRLAHALSGLHARMQTCALKDKES